MDSTPPPRSFEHVKVDSPEEFVRRLSPIDGDLHTYRNDLYLYRGQGHDWPLLPAAHRPDFWTQWSHLTGVLNQNLSWRAQAIAEILLLIRFVHVADRRGLLLPGCTTGTRWDLDLLLGVFAQNKPPSEPFLEGWPLERYLEVLALMQHENLPTALLDFTWNPLKAAYFAAIDAAKANRAGERLVVWAIKVDAINHAEEHGAQLVIPPGSRNRNLQAQEGVFITWASTQADDQRTDFKPTDLESLLKSVATPDRNFVATFQDTLPWCVKYSMPAECGAKLLPLLHRAGIDSSVLFPSYLGVSRSISEEKYHSPTAKAWWRDALENRFPLLPVLPPSEE